MRLQTEGLCNLCIAVEEMRQGLHASNITKIDFSLCYSMFYSFKNKYLWPTKKLFGSSFPY